MKRAQDLLKDVKLLSIQAGEAIMAIFKTDFEVHHKEDNTPLTAADMAAHHVIVDGLQQLTPQVPILSEESLDLEFKVRQQWQRYWLVDPLDGTKEFVKGSGEFSINIALIEDHEPVLGVIYSPVTKTTYYAYRSGGAFKRVDGQNDQAISIRKMRRNKIRIAGSRARIGPRFAAFLAKFDQYEIIKMGSSIKSCLVAEGEVDIYPRFGPTSEWDTAAAQCIVEEAGGMLVDTRLKPLRYNTKESLLNPFFIVVGDKQFDWLACIPDFSKDPKTL